MHRLWYGYSLRSHCFSLSFSNARLKAGHLLRLHLVRDHPEPQNFSDFAPSSSAFANLRISTTAHASKVRSELLSINNVLLTALASCIKQKWEHARDILRANLTDGTSKGSRSFAGANGASNSCTKP